MEVSLWSVTIYFSAQAEWTQKSALSAVKLHCGQCTCQISIRKKNVLRKTIYIIWVLSIMTACCRNKMRDGINLLWRYYRVIWDLCIILLSLCKMTNAFVIQWALLWESSVGWRQCRTYQAKTQISVPSLPENKDFSRITNSVNVYSTRFTTKIMAQLLWGELRNDS